jgi:hypothetical protein
MITTNYTNENQKSLIRKIHKIRGYIIDKFTIIRTFVEHKKQK